jgi:predicted dehydrogenase
MREVIGVPKRVLGASIGLPFWSVWFQYEDFPVTYESGINNIPLFDAHIEIYSQDKIIRINYDTPYVKGLPVTMTIRERVDGPQSGKGNGYQERTIRRTYEDAFTLEFLAFHECISGGEHPKTSLLDARQDLDIMKMIYKLEARVKSRFY